MMGKALHPSVQEFKEFVKRHPKLIQDVKGGKKTMQEFYEEWSIIGEKDDFWKVYRDMDHEPVLEVEATVVEKNGKKTKPKTITFDDMKAPMEWVGNMFTYLKGVDMNDLQYQINNVGTTIASIQSVINQFRSPASSGTVQTPTKQQPPKFNQKD